METIDFFLTTEKLFLIDSYSLLLRGSGIEKDRTLDTIVSGVSEVRCILEE